MVTWWYLPLLCLRWWKDINRHFDRGRIDSEAYMSHELTKVAGDACYVEKKDARWSFLSSVSVSLFSFFHLPLSFSSPLFPFFVLIDSPFFNTPFLDFKSIFHPSCCDGKCNVTSLSVLTCFAANSKKERKGCLNDLFHCMATCLNYLEHCGQASHTQQPLVKWQIWHVFLFQ